MYRERLGQLFGHHKRVLIKWYQFCWVAHGTLRQFEVMDSYDLDVYAEFVPTLYSTTSRSEYYKWEDTIINCYMIGELTLDQLANLANESFSPNVSLWLWSLRREHGDDYCTSWYEMKEVLR